MEQFANNCQTTVTTAYTAGDGHIHVASTAAPFPQIGDFRISIFDKSTGALKVILKVTTVTNTTDWVVTAEGTDAAVAVGDIVKGTMITAQVIRNIGRVLLEEYTASNSASLDFTAWYSADFDEYEIEIIGLLPVTDGAALNAFASTDGGSNYDTTAGNYTGERFYTTATGHTHEAADSAGKFALCEASSNNASWPTFGTLKLYPSTVFYQVMQGRTVGYDIGNNSARMNEIYYLYKPTSVINALRFKASSGNLASGTIRIYGMAK
jgi:hypothetical protein